MTKISYVNGQYTDHADASVSIDDRGYVFSDGVYDVALIKNGRYIDWPEHCERLQRSLDGLRINYRVSNDGLKAIVDVLLQKNGLSDAMLYLQITRGAAPRNHPFPSPEPEPALVMTVSQAKLPPAAQYENGVAVITLPDLRWKRRDYKTISLLPNIMAKQEAMEAGVDEAILVEDDGFVTEGSATNFFIVNKDGALQTHPLNPRILGGITRMGVLKVARENGIKVLEQPFTKDEMKLAQEAFITSTTKHILPVSNIDGKNIGTGKPGDVTKKLIVCYKAYIAKQIEG